MKYKQYFPRRSNAKPICSLKGTFGEIDYFPEGDDPFKRDDFYPMRIHFEYDGEAEGCEPFAFRAGYTIENLEGEDIGIVWNYAQMLIGAYSEWMLTNVALKRDSIVFIMLKFDDEGEEIGWLDINLYSFPPQGRIRIEIDTDSNYAADTYVITNGNSSEETPELIVEEYKNSKLLRTCKLGEDEHGKYELITEA